MKSNNLPLATINERLYYDETSSTKLRWKIAIGRKIKKDSEAGFLENNGYHRVFLKGKRYLVSRIIYYLFNGIDPGALDIDHVDGDNSNDLPKNLRLVTEKLNSRNRKLPSSNKTGVAGIFLFEHKSGRQIGQQKYLVQCTIQDKVVTRSFVLLKYGEEKAFELACKAREELLKQAEELNEGYTKRHGSKET